MAAVSSSGRLGLLAVDLGEREQEFDNNGWAHIHHAAFNGYEKSIIRFLKTKPDRLEILTQDDQDLTPLLVACISGQRDIVDILIEEGANLSALDRKMLGVVELSSLNGNTHLLEYFLENHNTKINVIKKLFNCLSGSNSNFELEVAACSSLYTLSVDASICHKIVESDGVKSSLNHLKSKLASEKSKDLCLDIILNMMNHIPIHDLIIETNGLPILVENISISFPSISLKSMKLLGMLASYGGRDVKHKIEELSGLQSIVEILKTLRNDPNLTKECLETIQIVISDDRQIQNSFSCKTDGLAILVELLQDSVVPEICVCILKALIAAVADNQQTKVVLADLGGVKVLLNILKSRSTESVLCAVLLTQKLAFQNEKNQELFIKNGTIRILTKILKRSRQIEGKAAVAGALWAIAGDKFHQKRAISTFMGYSTCLEFLGSSVPSQLHFYGSEAIYTLTNGVSNEIDDFAKAGAIQRLLHILGNSTTPSFVALSILKSLRSLCIAPGYFPHVKNQKECVNEGAIRIILNYARAGRTEFEKAESYHTLGAITYANRENLSVIKKTSDFSYIDILTLLYSNNSCVKETSGSALALFAFDSQKQLKEIASAGGIPYQHFVPFLMSEDKFCLAHAAFQMTVLSKIIPDEAPALTSATGIKILVDLLDSENEEVQTLSSSLLCGLSNLKSGVPDAIISIGTIQKLCKLLCSPFDIVQASAAVTLCQLNNHPEGQRQLLNACRHDPFLFKVLQRFPHRVQLSRGFQKRWKHSKDIGLPPIRYDFVLFLKVTRKINDLFVSNSMSF